MVKGQIPYIVIFCLYIVAVIYLCFAKPDDVPSLDICFLGLPFDKVAHFIMFTPFPILAYKVFDSENLTNIRRGLLIFAITAVGVGLAAMTELIQSHLSYRSADVYDLFSDFTGICAGVVVVIIYYLIRGHK